jgi:hypothetical protein
VLGRLYFGAVVLAGLDLAEGLLAGGFGFQSAGVGITFELTSPDVGVLADLLGVDDGGGEGLPTGLLSFGWGQQDLGGISPTGTNLVVQLGAVEGPGVGGGVGVGPFFGEVQLGGGGLRGLRGARGGPAYSSSRSAVTLLVRAVLARIAFSSRSWRAGSGCVSRPLGSGPVGEAAGSWCAPRLACRSRSAI